MPLGVYERRLHERVCKFCGRKFEAYGNRANCCGSNECKKKRNGEHKEAMRSLMRRKRAAEAAKKPPVAHVCEMCGAPVGKFRTFCDECRKTRKNKGMSESRQNATPRVRGGDGSGKWRDGRYARKRSSIGTRMADAEIVAGAVVPYIDPDKTRVEWRH